MAIQEQSDYYKRFEAEREVDFARQRARRVEPDRLPREVRDYLTPDPRRYETLTLEEASGLEVSDTVKLFVETHRGWVMVPNLRRCELGQRVLAFRRLPTPRAGGGIPRKARAMHQPTWDTSSSVSPEPSVSITTPAKDATLEFGKGRAFRKQITTHTVREGDTPESITETLTGQANPRALIGYADGSWVRHGRPLRVDAVLRVHTGAALLVGGGASETDSVTFTWSGPTSGQKTVPSHTGGWETTIPVQPGTYTLAVAAGESRHERKVNIIGKVKIVEMLYEPSTRTFYALSEDELQALIAASQPLDESVAELFQARVQGDQEGIARATDKVRQALRAANDNQPLAEGGSPAGITEVIRFLGKKVTLVPVGKLKRHWRRYKLDAEMQNRSRRSDLLDSDGRFSTARLLKRMKKRFEEASGFAHEFKADYSGALTAWAESFNSRPEIVLFRNSDAEGNTLYRATTEAQLLRYSAGASIAASFKPKKGKFGLRSQASTELALAEGRMRVAGYFPRKKGHPVQVELPMHDGSRKEADLGAMRAKLEMALYGFAGASAALSADIEFTVEQGKVLLKGVDNGRELKERDPRFTPVSASASAFAGVRAGCKVDGALEWDNLQKRPAEGEPAWRSLAGVGADANFSIGAGAEGEFTISYDRGKFYIRAKAAAVLGLGCGGDLAFTVHADNIAELVMFVYHRLKDEDFDKLRFIQELAFEVLYQLVLFEIWTGKKIAQQYAEGYDALSNWWDELVLSLQKDAQRLEAARSLAKHINNHPELLLFTTPEAKGHMLRVLCQTSILSFEEEQEEAIITILETLQSRRDYMETLEHMTFSADKIMVAEGERILRGILDGQEHYAWQRLRKRLMELPDALPVRAPVQVAVSFPANDTRTA